jgi:hypothetical protein
MKIYFETSLSMYQSAWQRWCREEGALDALEEMTDPGRWHKMLEKIAEAGGAPVVDGEIHRWVGNAEEMMVLINAVYRFDFDGGGSSWSDLTLDELYYILNEVLRGRDILSGAEVYRSFSIHT